MPFSFTRSLRLTLAVLAVALTRGVAAQEGQLTVGVDRPGVKISPMFYGLMTEEINHSYDGGLYAELIRNRAFKESPKAPDHWSVIQEGDGKASINLDNKQPVNNALTVCLRLDIENPGKRAGI